MTQLTTEKLVKIILGIFVFVVVAGGIYFFFRNYVNEFFKNMLGGEETVNLFLSLI
jgi:hypothetical protein